VLAAAAQEKSNLYLPDVCTQKVAGYGLTSRRYVDHSTRALLTSQKEIILMIAAFYLFHKDFANPYISTAQNGWIKPFFKYL
jgi:hypothetical protein